MGGIDMEKTHSLTMTDRRDIALTGVTDVKEFSETSVNLKTEMGALAIRGKKLTIGRLNTDTGELYISGEIDMIKYARSAGGGVIEGLFK